MFFKIVLLTISHLHRQNTPTDRLWHWIYEQVTFQNSTAKFSTWEKFRKQPSEVLTWSVPSLLRVYSPWGLYIPNIYRSVIGEPRLNPPLTICLFTAWSRDRNTLFFTEFIDKTFYDFPTWTCDKSSIERLIDSVYRANYMISDEQIRHWSLHDATQTDSFQ